MTDSVNVPSGLPMAMTCWPTFRAEASPIGIVGNDVVGSTLTTARSCVLSLATTVPASSEPSLNVTVIWSLPSMTWWFVRMSPEASKTKPDPTPVDGTENGPYPAWPAESTVIVTTAGLADSATATTASEDETLAGCGGARVRGRGSCRLPCPWLRGR